MKLDLIHPWPQSPPHLIRFQLGRPSGFHPGHAPESLLALEQLGGQSVEVRLIGHGS